MSPPFEVVIPTTTGPVAVLAVTAERGDLWRSLIVIGPTKRPAAISSAYNAFVKRPLGVIDRLFGPPAFPPWRVDIGAQIDTGSSWQLAVTLAHGLAGPDRLVGPDSGGLLWATGTVNPADLGVGAVAHVADKLRHSLALFDAARTAGREIIVLIAHANVADVDRDVADALRAREIVPVAVSTLSEAFAAAAIPLPALAATEVSWTGNPYRALQPFEREHRAIFFGRARAREEALELLRTAQARGKPFLLVTGPSGIGKSSFVRAGLIDDLARRSETPLPVEILVPGDAADPADALAGAMEGFAHARGMGTAAERVAGALVSPTLGRSLLVVDQLEGLFAYPAVDVAAFAHLLDDVVSARKTLVVATIRSDVLEQLDTLEAFSRLATRERTYRLGRPSRAELAEIIRAPAALAGCPFASAEVVEALADVAAASLDSLPLLESVLHRAVEHADRTDALTAADLERIGGFAGAVGLWADETIASMEATGIDPAEIDATLADLIRIDPATRQPLARPVEVVGGDPVLAGLVAGRLVSVGETEGRRVARIAHEALALHWPRLAGLAARLAAALVLRDELIVRAERWEKAGHDAQYLLPKGAQLDEARATTALFARRLAAVEPFVAASAAAADVADARERNQARSLAAALVRASRWLRATAAAAVVATIVAGGAIWFWQESRRNEASAVQQSILHGTALAANQLDRGELINALANARAIIGPKFSTDEVVRRGAALSILNRALAGLERDPAILRWHGSTVQSVAFSPDGAKVVTTSFDNTARLWDVASGRPLALLQGHIGTVYEGTFSPDNTRVVTAADDKALLWDVAGGRLIASLDGHLSSVVSARFSPDGSRIITASLDGSARLWDGTTGAALQTLLQRPPIASGPTGATLLGAACLSEILAKFQGEPLCNSVQTASFSSDGERALTASFDKVRVWNASTGEMLLAFGESVIESADFSPDGKLILTTSQGASAQLWDSRTGSPLATFDESGIARFSPDGKQIVTGSYYQLARIWDPTGQQIAVLQGTDREGTDEFSSVEQTVFSPDGALLLVASSDGSALLWRVSTGRLLARLEGHTDGVEDAAFSPDGMRIATASRDGTARLWDTTMRRPASLLDFWNTTIHGPVSLLAQHGDRVTSAVLSPDGETILTASYDGTARLLEWSGHERIRLADPKMEYVQSARFSSDGTRIVTASLDGSARLWDAATGRLQATLIGHTDVLDSAEFSPDGTRVVTASSDRTARIWDAGTGTLVATLSGHTEQLSAAEFSPDGARILTASMDHTARLWNARTGDLIAPLTGHTDILRAARFSPDGTRVVTTSRDGAARLWDGTTGAFLAGIAGHATQPVVDAFFSLDGVRLVTASGDGTAQVWDMGGAPLAIMAGNSEPVTRVVPSPDGRRIATASWDGTARLWDAESGLLLAVYAGHSGRLNALHFALDGTRIVTASEDGTVRLWNVSPAVRAGADNWTIPPPLSREVINHVDALLPYWAGRQPPPRQRQ